VTVTWDFIWGMLAGAGVLVAAYQLGWLYARWQFRRHVRRDIRRYQDALRACKSYDEEARREYARPTAGPRSGGYAGPKGGPGTPPTCREV